MKFTCNKNDLLKTMAAAEPITGSKSNFTILANILIEANENSESITIKASNQEISLTARIPAKIATPGSTTVIQNKLYSIVKQLPEGGIAIESNANSTVSVKSMDEKRNADANIMGLSPKDFPDIPVFSQKKESITVDKLYFKRMIQKVIFCVSTDNSKYTLDGIFFECLEKTMKMIGIDGRRMAMIESEYPENKHEDFSTIIPNQFLHQLQKVLLSEGVLDFYFSNNRLHVKVDNLEFSVSVLNGNFPDYKTFMPQTYQFNLTVSNRELINAIDLASVMVDPDSNKLMWKISENKLNISTQHSDYGNSKEDVVIAYEGTAHEIGINYKLISEILKEIETKEVEFKFNNAVSPISINEKNRKEYFFILMPMKLDN